MEEQISVIVPVYQVEALLDRCLESLVAQTYQNLEIILVDDGSTDCCPTLCDRWADRDGRIRVIHKCNEGVGYARNTGMAQARGQYLLFVDSDDHLPPDGIAKLYAGMQKDNSDMVIGKHVKVYDDGIRESSCYCWKCDHVISGKELLQSQMLQQIPVSAWGKLYRRSLFRDIHYPALRCGEDLWVFPLIADRCSRISIVEHTVYGYYQRPESIMHRKNPQQKEDELKATVHMAAFLWNRGYERNAEVWFCRATEQAWCLSSRKRAVQILREGIGREGRHKLIRALPLKSRIQYSSIFCPGLYLATQGFQALRKRKKELHGSYH